MPIQLLLDWSKALVAIVCSLLLAVSFIIMCTAKPVAIRSNHDGNFHVNRSHLLVQNAIETENRLNASSATANAMPLNISVSENPFGFYALKNGTTVAKWRTIVAQRSRKMAASPSERNITGILATTTTTAKVSMAIHPLNASNELNLAAMSNDEQHQANFKRHKSLANTLMNPPSTGQHMDITEPSNTLHERNATQHHTVTNYNVAELIGEQFAHSTNSPIMQTIHQSTITTKTPIQSVFLDYLTNFNGTKTQHIDSIKRNHNNNLRNANQSRHSLTTADDMILSRTERSVHIASNKRKTLRNDSNNADRIERSANFSLTKHTRRIQLLIKGRFVQMLPDGTVNGTQDDQSEYTVLQRNTVDVGQIRLIGIATCLYLCMDSCGNLYSSREFTNDCIFNERLENNYNYYTSTHHSSALRTYYMALNRLGVPRKTHLPSNKPLGKLSTYARAFTLIVPEPRSDAIIGKRFGLNHVRHGIKHLCESGKQLMELTTKQLAYPECNSGSSGSLTSSSSSSSSSTISSGSSNSNLSNKQPYHHHIRHANTNHRRLAPAPLTESRVNKKTAASGTIVKSANCDTEQCLKKQRKIQPNGNRSGGNSSNNYQHNANKKAAKRQQFQIHSKTTAKRPSRKTPTTMTTKKTTTTKTTTSTESAVLYNSRAPYESNVPDNYDDDLDYVSGSLQVPSNGQSGLASDEEDYDNDK